ncbi:MAG: hypothetical protein ACOVOR_00585 [Rhabdochlamydiaceae bacterium]
MKFITRKKYFLLISFCLYGIWQLHQFSNVQVNVMEMEPIHMKRRDKNALEKFFRGLIVSDSFAFTLADSKPASFSGFSASFLPPNPTLRKGWKTWKKYCDLFDNQNIMFWEEDSTFNKDQTLLIIANKKKLMECLESQEEDFKSVLKDDFVDAVSLLEKRPFFSSGLKSNHFLIGIVLGFGRGNAAYFQERFHLDHLENTAIWSDEILIPLYNKMVYTMFGFKQHMIENMLPPVFVGYPDSEESKFLKDNYWDVREKIINYYQGKDFLEATLNLYMHGRSIL